ncbi:MAG: integrase core domain-containing protein [bacterium]|nr:integrase core domain-containing protein [bacterium]
MVTITQSYQKLKKQYGEIVAREILLECYEQTGCNQSETARSMQCNRRTVIKALSKQEQGDLKDMSHTPHTQPNQTDSKTEALVLKWREQTKRGKVRLHKILLDEEKISVPISTVGKILKRNKVKVRDKKRKHRSKNPPAYDFSSLCPFEKFQYDTKDYLDKQALKQELYNHVLKYGLPQFQWTIIDIKSRIRFLAWSYQLTRSNGMAFELMVKAWLAMHGLALGEIEVQSDGGTEVGAMRRSMFERNQKDWWDHLGMKRRVIRMGHPEDDCFVERSHLTDDEEFYLPFLDQIKTPQQLISRGVWWQDYYNRLREHTSLQGRSPYQYLKAKGYCLPESFCRFPSVILDTICVEPEVIAWQKTVYDHLDHDLVLDSFF